MVEYIHKSHCIMCWWWDSVIYRPIAVSSECTVCSVRPTSNISGLSSFSRSPRCTLVSRSLISQISRWILPHVTRSMDSWSASASIPNLEYNWKKAYNETTRTACMMLCTAMHGLLCSSFFYDTQYRSCLLTSHTGEVLDDADACGVKRVEYYRRKRCLSRLLHC